MRVLYIGFFVGLIYSNVSAHDEILIGEKVQLESAILNESRELWISTPSNYQKSNEYYPVLYLLDGDSNFRHTSATAEFLAASNRIPNLIVVGVLNTDRARDLTPPSQNPDEVLNYLTHGGADNFQLFFENELFPFIENTYRVRPYKILIGHSLGGLFAVHTLTTRPDLFNAYIAISPSLRWSNQVLVNQAEQFLKSSQRLEVDLYLTIANEGGSTLAAFRKLTGVLGEYNPSGFRWKFEHMPEEHHGSVALRSTYYGLESIFDGWSLEKSFEAYTIGGLAALENAYLSGGTRFGYERSYSKTLLLQIASQLIDTNRISEADQLVTKEFDAVPPSYFLNLLADKYRERGNSARAQELYGSSLLNNPTDVVARTRLEKMGIDPTPYIKEFSVDVATLERYVGEYQLQPDFNFTIFLEGLKLYAEGTRQRSTELVPISETRFSMAETDSQLEFVIEFGARANKLVLHKFGVEMEAPRIEK